MIYTCNACLFTFKRIGEPKTCPDCGKSALREATREEQDEFNKNQATFIQEEN